MKIKNLIHILWIFATCHFSYGQFIQNGNFESTPDFQNWTISGDASIWTAGVNGFPAGDGSSVKYAELSTDDLSGAASASTLEGFLGLSSGTLGTQGGGTAGVGSAIRNVTVTVTQADLNAGNRILSLRWDLVTDLNPAFNTSQKDYGFLILSGPSSAFFKLGDIQSPNMHLDSPQLNNFFKYETGWQTFSHYQFPFPGTYTLSIGVVGINPSGVTTGLLVDSIQLTAVGLGDPTSTSVDPVNGECTDHVTLSATVASPGGTVEFFVNGVFVGSAAVTGGLSTLDYVIGLPIGNFPLEAVFIGDSIFTSNSQGTSTLTVTDTTAPVPDVVSLPAVTGPSPVSVTSTPTATDNCAGTITGTTTDPLTYTDPGTYTITWHYDDRNGNLATQTQSVTVTGQATSLAYSGATSGTVGGRVSLSATLKASTTGSLLAGQTINFVIGAQSVSAVTNKKGTATARLVLNQSAGNYTVQAVFAGTSAYASSTASSAFVLSAKK